MNESNEKQEPAKPGWFERPLWHQGWMWCGVLAPILYVPVRLLYGPGAVYAYWKLGLVFCLVGMICYELWRRYPHKKWLFHVSGFLMSWVLIAYMLSIFLKGTKWA